MNRIVVLSLCLIITIICCSSCVAAIDTAAANSISAIVATIFEYIFALVVLVFALVFWIARGVGLSAVVLGLFATIKHINLILPNGVLIVFGLLLFGMSLFNIRLYTPKVIINKKIPSTLKSIHEPYKFSVLKEVILPVVIAVLSLFIEYYLFIPNS